MISSSVALLNILILPIELGLIIIPPRVAALTNHKAALLSARRGPVVHRATITKQHSTLGTARKA